MCVGVVAVTVIVVAVVVAVAVEVVLGVVFVHEVVEGDEILF